MQVTPYEFRKSTQEARSLAPASEFSRSGRKILPLEATPSLILSPQKRPIIREETTQIKVSERISTFFVDRHIEQVLGCQMERGKTSLQGSRAPRGFQAAHSSLAPSLVDDTMEQIKARVLSNGVTPKKSEPYLRSRMNARTPELKALTDNRQNPDFVNQYFDQAPKFTKHSSTFGSYYGRRRNATFENPDASNQFDSSLEAFLKPQMKTLIQGTPQESTENLAKAIVAFYNEAIPHLEKQIELLNEFHLIEGKLIAFEENFRATNHATDSSLAAYKADVKELFRLKAAILEKKTGVSSCKSLSERRRDFFWLNLIATDKVEFANAFSFLKTPLQEDITPFTNRYELMLAEAKVQLQETNKFQSKEAIESLETLMFGIMEDGARRAPTPDEIQEQVFQLIRVSPIKRPSSKRVEEGESKIPTGKRLNF